MVYSAVSDDSGTISTFLRYDLIKLNHSGALTDYQKLIEITFDIHMQTAFQDIRFTTLLGVHVPYWIVSKIDSTSANVWIKSDYLDGDTLIKMYYGNSGLSDGSSGNDTFIQYHGAATTDYLDSLTVAPSNIIYESYLKVTSAVHNNLMGLSNSANVADDGIYFQLYENDNNKKGINENENTATVIIEAPDVPINTYINLKFTHDGSIIHYYIDDNEISTGSITNFPDENLGLLLWNPAGTLIQDWSFIRKYTATEPTYTITKNNHQRLIPAFIN